MPSLHYKYCIFRHLEQLVASLTRAMTRQNGYSFMLRMYRSDFLSQSQIRDEMKDGTFVTYNMKQ